MKKYIKFTGMALSVVLASGITSLPVYATENTTNSILEKPIKLGFTDIQNHWAEQAILKWTNYGLISGVGDGQFNPNGTITRADFSTLVGRIANLDIDKELLNPTSDIESNNSNSKDYYSQYMLSLYNLGAITMEDSKLRPTEDITREEAAFMLEEVFGLPDTGYDKTRLNTFKDIDLINPNYYKSLEKMVGYGFINGTLDNKINPKGSLTRAEAVTMLNNMLGSYYSTNSECSLNKLNYSIITNNENVSIKDTDTNYIVRVYSPKVSIKNSDIKDLIQGGRFDNSIVSLNNTNIENIYIYGNTTLHSIDDKSKVGNLIVKSGQTFKVSESILTKHKIDKITLEPNTTICIEDAIYKNSYHQAISIRGDISKEELKSTDKIKLNTQILSNNEVKSNIVLNTNVKEAIYGLIVNKSNTVPTLNNFDIKQIQKGSNDVITHKQNPNETWCYRGFIQYKLADGTDVVEYTEPISKRAYNYSINTELRKDEPVVVQGELKSIVKPVYVTISGENIPDIQSIQVLSGKDKYSDQLMKTNVSLDSTSLKDGHTKRVYRANVTYPVNPDDGSVDMDAYHGVVVNFVDGTVDKMYPTITDEKSLENGSILNLGSGVLNILNDTLTVEDNSINKTMSEYGIAYKFIEESEDLPEHVDNTWKFVKATGSTNGKYTVSIPNIGSKDKIIAYSAYCKDDSGTFYSDIKKVIGDGAPKYTGRQNVLLNHDGTIATLKIGIDSYSDIDLTKSSISMENVNSTLKDLDGSYRNGILTFTLEGLSDNQDYNAIIHLENFTGFSSNIDIHFNTL